MASRKRPKRRSSAQAALPIARLTRNDARAIEAGRRQIRRGDWVALDLVTRVHRRRKGKRKRK